MIVNVRDVNRKYLGSSPAEKIEEKTVTEMTKSEQLQFCERLDNLLKIVSDKLQLANNSSLVQEDEWGGADLIITTNPDRNHWETDTFVVVEDIKPILWLMYELRKLYN